MRWVLTIIAYPLCFFVTFVVSSLSFWLAFKDVVRDGVPRIVNANK